MPPRRSHKKSKAGCQRCKNRKIKCDEVHPTCGNCLKHGVSCDFEDAKSPSTYSPPSLLRYTTEESSSSNYYSSSIISRSSSIISRSPSMSTTILPFTAPAELVRINMSPAADRLLELKLMHHFTALTAQTLSDGDDQQFAWRVHIPCMAYEAPHLMDALLAVSALHLRSQIPNDASVVRASHAYMASSISRYSTLLSEGVNATNAEALFATSALIAFQASASRFFEKPGGIYTLPLAWFHAFQGVKAVVMASWQWLRTSSIIYPIINGQPALSLDPDPYRRLFFSSLLDGIEEELERTPEMLCASTKQGYEHAVSFLNWAHVKPVRARILGFAAAVSRRFIDLLSQHAPRALAIVACWFALTKKVDDVWWLTNVATREVNGLYSLLPPEWWDKMGWPMMIANHAGPIDDSLWGIHIDEETEMIEEMGEPVHSHIDMLAQLMKNTELPD